jgi:hypothetical protein
LSLVTAVSRIRERRWPKRLRCWLLAFAAALGAGTQARAETILFIGNSFTYGAHSPVWRYRGQTVTDLNGDGVGGVPALFKLFTQEAGLDYQVSLATHGGVGLQWHWDNDLSRVDRAWDHVVLQSLSTLDQKHPGDPASLIDYVGRFATRFTARNPRVDIRLNATWSRPDLTYLAGGVAPSPWRGKPIFAMADDLSAAYRLAAARNPGVKGVVETGEAFNAAIRAGVADPDPYDGLTYGQVDLWTYDHYHASAWGYYLEALTLFAAITGQNPATLGGHETAAAELGISPDQAVALQQIAHQPRTQAQR